MKKWNKVFRVSVKMEWFNPYQEDNIIKKMMISNCSKFCLEVNKKNDLNHSIKKEQKTIYCGWG